MDCERVEALLPLYVGSDLEEENARLVTAHVQTCAGCARSAQEYVGANQLLQMFEPPQFSEATFAAVRSRVLREIERESSAPKSIFGLEFLRRSFQPRVMWAVSTVVLLAVCLFAYYLIANRTSGPRSVQPMVQNGGGGEQKTREQKASKGIKPDITGTGVSPAPETPPHKLRLHQAARHPPKAGVARAVPERTATYSAEPKGAAPNASATADKTLRLEIQTTDPNVRIIWFSQSSTKEGSPSESSKGI